MGERSAEKGRSTAAVHFVPLDGPGASSLSIAVWSNAVLRRLLVLPLRCDLLVRFIGRDSGSKIQAGGHAGEKTQYAEAAI